MLGWLPPGLLLALLLTVIVAQLFKTFWPQRPGAYPALLLGAAVGIGAGQLWAWLGLPTVELGSTNLLPGLGLALVLAPLAERLRLRPQIRRRAAPGSAPKIR
jgi:hypothetical protein